MSAPNAPRQLFVTTALPYANGNFHIGHIMEYIQADIWVRVQRMQGNQVNFVGADDTHGAPIMIAAEKRARRPSSSWLTLPQAASLIWTVFIFSSTTGTAPTHPKTTSWPARFTVTCATSARRMVVR
jgi:methionyl-tRNA synthetase